MTLRLFRWRPVDGLRRALRIRILDVYVARLFVLSYGASAIALVGLYVVMETFNRLENFTRHEGALPLVIGRYFLAMIPCMYVEYLGPVLTASAGMFTVALLNRTNELTPMKACGVSFARICAPIFLAAVIFTGSAYALQEHVLPAMRDRIREAVMLKSRRTYIVPDIVGDGLGQEIWVHRYWPKEKRGSRCVIVRGGRGTRTLITADEILYRGPERGWLLRGHVASQTFSTDDAEPWTRREVADQMPFETDIIPTDLEDTTGEVTYLALGEIWRQYRAHPVKFGLLAKFYDRLANPLTHIILLLVGLPMLLGHRVQSVLLAVGTSILVCGGYLILRALGLELGTRGVLLPSLAIWLPLAFYLALGLALFEGIRA